MNNQDVRVLRTDRLIRDAFLTLLAEKGFEAMTVQDILDLTQ
ncbi:TetR/AcrR family transcriptional regulator, partial [Aggregatibacter actinomycetemcomitans]